MSAGYFAVRTARAGMFAAALVIFGASDLRADTTDEQCQDAWAESEASATCTDTTAEAAFGNECQIQTTCDKEGFPTAASITRPLDDISELHNCLATLTVGPCDESPPEDPPEPTPQEECEDAFAESPAAGVCEVRTVKPQGEGYCWVDVDCTASNGRTGRAIIVRSVELTAELRYCGSGMLSPGLCPGESPPMEDQCSDAWSESQASATCSDTTITVEPGDECKIETTCDKEGFPTSASITRPLENISELHNCLATLTVGPCDDDGQPPAVLGECLDAWGESPASDTCGNPTVSMESGGAECGIATTCYKDGGQHATSITRPPADISALLNCSGTLAIGECQENPDWPSQMKRCTDAWEESEASATCYGTTIAPIHGYACAIETLCYADGTLTPGSITWSREYIPNLYNCAGDLRAADKCDEEEEPEQAPDLLGQCLDAWGESPASDTCEGETTVSLESDGTECGIATTCYQNGGQNPTSITRPLADIATLSNCSGTLTAGECQEDPNNPSQTKQCQDAWEESEASATCQGTTILPIYGYACTVETSCYTEDSLVPASITLSRENISGLTNCLGVLYFGAGPCGEDDG